jgi:uncharacterized protein YdeI (BOF family)
MILPQALLIFFRASFRSSENTDSLKSNGTRIRVVQEALGTPDDVVVIIPGEVYARISEDTFHPARRGEDYSTTIIDASGMSIEDAQREIIILQD